MKRLKIFQGKNIIHCGINLTQLPFEKSRLKPRSLLHCVSYVFITIKSSFICLIPLHTQMSMNFVKEIEKNMNNENLHKMWLKEWWLTHYLIYSAWGECYKDVCL